MAGLGRPGPPSGADFHQAISMYSGRCYSACLNITWDPELAAAAFGLGLAGALARLTEIERLCFLLKHMEQ